LTFIKIYVSALNAEKYIGLIILNLKYKKCHKELHRNYNLEVRKWVLDAITALLPGTFYISVWKPEVCFFMSTNNIADT
jgi:hypothetical protein